MISHVTVRRVPFGCLRRHVLSLFRSMVTLPKRVVLPRLPQPPVVIAPACLIQRRLAPGTGVVPDLLAIRPPSAGDRGLILVAEIDLGGGAPENGLRAEARAAVRGGRRLVRRISGDSPCARAWATPA